MSVVSRSQMKSNSNSLDKSMREYFLLFTRLQRHIRKIASTEGKALLVAEN